MSRPPIFWKEPVPKLQCALQCSSPYSTNSILLWNFEIQHQPVQQHLPRMVSFFAMICHIICLNPKDSCKLLSQLSHCHVNGGAAFPKALVHNCLYHITCLRIIESFRLAKTLKVIQSMDPRETYCNYHILVLSVGREVEHMTLVMWYLIILHAYTIQYFVQLYMNVHNFTVTQTYWIIVILESCVGRDLKDCLLSMLLLWARTLSTRRGCLKAHPTWKTSKCQM